MDTQVEMQNQSVVSAAPVTQHIGDAQDQRVVSAVRVAQPAKGRSAVSNGKRLHVVATPNGHETKWARRFRDVLGEIISDMGRDGLSEGQRQLARRCATIAIACEKMEGDAAAGNEIDLEQYGMLTDRLGRAFGRLGLRRQAKPVEDVFAYIAKRYPKETPPPSTEVEDAP
jgi:hypothetical protein